jgi:hypothetical protein
MDWVIAVCIMAAVVAAVEIAILVDRMSERDDRRNP